MGVYSLIRNLSLTIIPIGTPFIFLPIKALFLDLEKISDFEKVNSLSILNREKLAVEPSSIL
jgi:hypothetical protein